MSTALPARAMRIISSPVREWQAIAGDRDAAGLAALHVVVLSGVAALAWSMGVLVARLQTGPWPSFALFAATTMLLSVMAVALLAAAMAIVLPMYEYERRRDWRGAWIVAAYASTPALLCSALPVALPVAPALAVAMVMALPYCGYLLFLGAQRVLGVAPRDAAEFTAVSMLLAVLGSMVCGGALAAAGLF